MLAIISSVATYSPSVVFNTKYKNADGVDVCAWNEVKILPKSTLNQPGLCRELYCGEDFTIFISKCAKDVTGKCQYEGADNTKDYPDCCGVRVCE